MKLPRQGVLLVVSGPSGVGKGTLIRGLLVCHPQARISVSCTTRPPRPGEQEGVDYCFVSPEEFARLRAGGELLEWAEVYPGTLYGTPRAPVEQAWAAGKDLILEIDGQGAMAVREALGQRAVLVFVAPPSFGDLRRRLEGRHTESAQSLRERLATARREIGEMGRYDYLVVNDEVAPAVEQLVAILTAEQSSLRVAPWQQRRDRLLAQAAEEAGPDA